MKPTLGLILVSLVLLGSVIAAHYYLMPPPNLNPVSMFNITGELEVYKNGVLVHKGPDLLTNNFYAYLHNTLLGAWNYGSTSQTTSCPTPSWAANPGVPLKRPDAALECTFSAITNANGAARIGFGTGTAVPQRTDYILTSSVYETIASIAFNAPSSTAQKANLTFTASYTPSSAVSITEVGLYWMLWVQSSSVSYYALVAHDTIPTQSLNAGDVLTVVYRFVAPVNFETIGSLTPLNGGTPFLGLIAQCVARSTSVSGLPASATFGSYCVGGGSTNIAGANIVFISPDGNTQVNNQGLLSNSVSAPRITIVGYIPQSMTIGSISYRITYGSQVYNVLTFFLTTNRDLVGGQAAGLQFSGP